MNKDLINLLPRQFVENTIALCGDKGESWLDVLSQIIKEIEHNWSIKVGRHFSNLSYNYVAPATYLDGSEAVLKIGLPLSDVEIFGEAAYLKLLDGRGSVRLLEFDRNRQAILLERLNPGENLKIICKDRDELAVSMVIQMLRSVIREVPNDAVDFIQLDDWFDGLKRASGTKFPKKYASKARMFYDKMSLDTKNIFLLHGDLHHENILSAQREPFLAIDPKGIVGHVGYDMGVFLNNHHWWLDSKPDAKERLYAAVNKFSKAFDIDPENIRKWAFAQMVLSWWWTFDEAGVGADELGLSDIWNV